MFKKASIFKERPRGHRGGTLFMGLLFVAAGLAVACGFAPFHYAWLSLIGLTGYFLLLSLTTSLKARLGGAVLFGIAWFFPGLLWLTRSIVEHGRLPVPVGWGAVFLLAAVLSLFPAAAAAAGGAFKPARRLTAFFLSQSAALVLAEWLRAQVVAKFGWFGLGYIGLDTPLIGWAPVGGVYAVTLALSVLAASLALFIRARRIRTRLMTLVPVAAVLFGGAALDRLEYSRPAAILTAQVLQPDMPVIDAFSRVSSLERIRRLNRLLEAPGDTVNIKPPQVVLAPEGIIAQPLSTLSPQAASTLFDVVERAGAPLLFNAFRLDKHGYYNTSFLLTAGGVTNVVDKRRLVPFGEFVPAGARWIVELLGIPMSDLLPGQASQPAWQLGDVTLGILICYENLYGDVVRSYWNQNVPDVLAVTSNLGWFSTGILAQHLDLTRFRAIEASRPIINVSNTGLSGWVDQKGRIRSAMPVETAGRATLNVQTQKGAPTPYIRLGDWPSVGLALLLYLFGIWPGKRRRFKLGV